MGVIITTIFIVITVIVNTVIVINIIVNTVIVINIIVNTVIVITASDPTFPVGTPHYKTIVLFTMIHYR